MEAMAAAVFLLGLISLTSANTAPEINNIVYNVCEDTPIEEPAFTISASDPEGDPLTYEISGVNAAFFSVGRNTGVVTVKRQLDRESSDVMPLSVTVSDGFNTREAELTIILGDANDNRPLFVAPSYESNVLENTTVGSSLFKARATDADTGSAASIRYSIDEVFPNERFGHFSIVPTTGEVRLAKPLNYTSLDTFYRLKINASDGGGRCHHTHTTYLSSVVFAFITVVDIPDLDPKFVSNRYSASVEENSPVGRSVITVTALDQDTGIMDDIIYSIEASTAEGLFVISPNDGTISVSSLFDREVVGDAVTLTVKATESRLNIHGVQASTTASVHITIADVNDEKPQFYKCENSGAAASCVLATQFTGHVVEHQLGSVPINMMVKDLDKNPVTELTLQGEGKEAFSVTQVLDMVQLVVRDSQILDFEVRQQMILQLIAIDEEEPSFRSTATVTINILDANDNSPAFLLDTYKLSVDEHSPAGTIVSTINATDPDTMDKGRLDYRLLPESILPIFDVEPLAGTIFVKNSTLLDREVKAVHSMTLQARDTAGQIGTTAVEITLADINDQRPVMSRDSYLEYVREGQPFTVRIEATDSDEPGTANSRIRYGIMPGSHQGNFSIDASTGELTNSGPLDREALDPALNGRIQLNVTATDGGAPPLSSFVTVTINVEDVNDNKPQFEAPLYQFSVREGTKGANVGSVFAEDLDQTTNFNRISFSISSGSFGSFIIRTTDAERGYRGVLTVDPDVVLDYESDRKNFTLQVRATDLEQKSAEVMVEVEVQDVNDERPEFTPVAAVAVKENTTITEAIGSFTAIDRDGNHSLVFHLESVKCRCNNSMTACSWFILDPTGDVRVNPDQDVDYELCDQAVVTAQVVDEFTEMGESDSASPGEMVINIEDINDNAPEFIPSNSVFVVVSESANRGTSVAKVAAVDRDSGVNRQIEFEVTAVEFQNLNEEKTPMKLLFEAVTIQMDTYVGNIQTTEALDLKLQGKYLVTVTATDPGGLFSSTVMDIFTVDESYRVELEFEGSQIEVDKRLDEIRRTLMDATKATVEIVASRPGTNEVSRASESTLLVTYFVFFNGTALTSAEVEKKLSDPEYYLHLAQLGLKYIGQSVDEDPEVDHVKFVLLGMLGGLVIVLAVLTTSLLCTRRNYRRKLKAAKAMNSASMITADNQKSGPIVPGTNKYTKEGANPVLNVTIALDMDEDSSDVDKVSLNSLDYMDNMALPETGVKTNMLMLEEEDGDNRSDPPEYIEPLGEALAQRGQKTRNVKFQGGHSNPAFDTTDL